MLPRNLHEKLKETLAPYTQAEIGYGKRIDVSFRNMPEDLVLEIKEQYRSEVLMEYAYECE